MISTNPTPPNPDSLAKMRREYNEVPLEESQIPSDGVPFSLVQQWLQEAREAKVTEPNAMCLTTIQAGSRPDARHVILQSFNEQEGTFTWYTDYRSKKAQELLLNPYASLCFWWGDLERSIRVEGIVEKVPAEESAAYFQKRPYKTQLGLMSMHQSQPVADIEEMKQRYQEAQDKYPEGTHIERPETWGGYRLKPDMIEFWKGRSSRLHDRLEFRLEESNNQWSCMRLQP